MPAPMTPMTEDQTAARRARARRTAWIVAAIAVVIYVGFILSGVLSR